MTTTQFFKREEKKIHGLTEEQLREAFDIYEKKVTQEIFDEVAKEYNVEFKEDETKRFIGVFISKAIFKGMELVQDTSLVTDYYKEAKQIQTDNRCGIVDRTDDTFYPCSFGSHWQKIKEVMQEKYADKYEALEEMTYSLDNKTTYKGITKQEIDEFIMNNFSLLGGTNAIESYLG